MTPKDRVISALEHEGPDRTPVAIFTQSTTLGQMDLTGVSWPEAHTSSEKMAALGSAQADIFGFESMRVPFCVSAEAERLGCAVDLGSRNRSPTVISSPFSFDPYNDNTVPDLISPSEFVSSGRIETIIDAVTIMSGSHENIPAIAGVTGLLTSLGQMIGTENMVIGTLTDPENIRKWTETIGRIFREYIQCLSDAGADIVIMAEASGSPDIIDPSMFDMLTGNHLDCLSDVKGAHSVLHICGDAYPILDNMIHTKVDGLSVEGRMDPYKTVKKVNGRAALIGNIDTIGTLMLGTPEKVRSDVSKCLDAGFDIVAPGCGVPISTSNDNLLALSDTFKLDSD